MPYPFPNTNLHKWNGFAYCEPSPNFNGTIKIWEKKNRANHAWQKEFPRAGTQDYWSLFVKNRLLYISPGYKNLVGRQ